MIPCLAPIRRGGANGRRSRRMVDRELAGCNLADERLNKRLRKLVAQIGSAMGESIPLVC